MTRKPTFWVVLGLLGLAGSFLAFRLFPLAFPILSVEIETSRGEALTRAGELADRYGWGPAEFRQAASFGHQNPAFQSYMELEGGGLEEVNRLVREGFFTLYAWRVRHFAQGSVEETEIRFKPSGEPYGFQVRLPEDAPGRTLSQGEALNLAVAGASADWGIEADRYELLESSEEERPGGRVDHTFVFERTDLPLGEASIRLRLRVSGDRLTEVAPVLHVPEGFLRRYQDTRNANETISLIGTIAFVLLFMVMAGGSGMVHLLRQRQIEWKAPLAWGALVAGLMALGGVNSLPLAWMEYDTALPAQIYVTTVVVVAVLTFLAGTVLLALLFMAGEGLMRLGFPHQIQQWKMWAPGVANSTPALGRTVAPYLLVGLKLGFVVLFYLVTTRRFGWWSPASALVEPDLLATYLPWLTAVSTSLFAAFSEETVFRAIPIGAAAILGRRFGRAGLWIWGTVILQALVFGASHANYPQQPAYARVVEIFPSYLAWGAICVYFGLIPSILGHFTYNLVLFSLPLFAADTGGIWLDRLVVVLAGTLPLGVVLLARLRRGGVAKAPDWALNRNWSPPSSPRPEAPEPRASAPAPEEPRSRAEAGEPVPGAESGEPVPGAESGEPVPGAESGEPIPGGDDRKPAISAGERAEPSSPGDGTPEGRKPPHGSLPRWGVAALALAALFGTALWGTALADRTSFRLVLSHAQAEDEARSLLAVRGDSLGPEWIPLPSVSSGRGLDHQFAWREGSEEEYRELLGRFLDTPGWRIRFVSFQLPPEERAESFTVRFSTTEEPPRVSHTLPEGRPGENLGEDEARALALQTLRDRIGTPPREYREISAEETARPARTDWTFNFAATEGYPLGRGEGRWEIRIAGNEVVGVRSFIHIPEEWEREWRADESRRTLALLPISAVLLLLGLALLILAIVLWSRGSLDTAPLRVLGGALAAVLLLSAVNSWPATLGTFTTQMSFGNQLLLNLFGTGLSVAFLAVGVGLVGALGQTWIPRPRASVYHPALTGLALGAAFVGASRLLSAVGPQGLPEWPAYDGAVAFLPWLSPLLEGLTGFLTLTALALLAVAILERLLGTRWSWAGVLLALFVGFTLAPNPVGSSWLVWVGGGLALSASLPLLWLLARALGWAIVPGVMAAPILLGLAEDAVLRPFPWSTLGAVLGAVAVVEATRRWSQALRISSLPPQEGLQDTQRP